MISQSGLMCLRSMGSHELATGWRISLPGWTVRCPEWGKWWGWPV